MSNDLKKNLYQSLASIAEQHQEATTIRRELAISLAKKYSPETICDTLRMSLSEYERLTEK